MHKFFIHQNATSGISPPSSNTLLTSLASYYKLDDTGSVAVDSHSNHDGVNSNVTNGVIGKINTAYDFDGTNSLINFGDVTSFEYNTSWSVSAWIYRDVDQLGVIISKVETLSPGRGWFLAARESGINNYRLHVFLRHENTETGRIQVYSNGSVTLNEWFHVVLTYDGSATAAGTNLYINGVLNGKDIIDDSLTGSILTTEDLLIGSRPGPIQNFGGIIDEVGLWNRELSLSDVSSLYNSGNGLPLSSYQ